MTSPYSPEWQAFIDNLGNELLLKGTTLEEIIGEANEQIALVIEKYGEPVIDYEVTTEEIGGLNLADVVARIYTPPNPTGDEPITIFIHGGGWVMGSMDFEDGHCRTICRYARTKLVSLEYRQAPVHQYPIALDDCVTATNWVLERFVGRSVAIMGGSAGGNMSFAVALKLIEAGQGERVKGVSSLTPLTVHPQGVPEDMQDRHTSYEENAWNTVNTINAMKVYLDCYNPPKEDKWFSILVHDRLKDLKKVHIVEAGTDTVRDDARLMREVLGKAGVSVMYDSYPGLPHYFWSYPVPELTVPIQKFNNGVFAALAWIHAK